MNKEQILKQIENNNNIMFKLQNINKNKCNDLIFKNTLLSLKLSKIINKVQ